MKFTIAGGDSRNLTLGNILAQSGHSVEYMAPGEDIFRPVYTDYVIGPIPFTTDGENINAPLLKRAIKCKAFTDSIMSAKALIAGKIPETVKKELEEKGIRTYDYLDREEMAILNSIPTAEGAISVAMQELDVTLHGAKALVIGYGRCGKTLAGKLKALNCDTYVLCRKKADHAACEANGLYSISDSETTQFLQKMDVIFNTAPALVLDRLRLAELKPGAVIIDIASLPGGCDDAYADEHGIKIIHALSLPGKVAPVTAANILYKVIEHIINERS